MFATQRSDGRSLRRGQEFREVMQQVSRFALAWIAFLVSAVSSVSASEAEPVAELRAMHANLVKAPELDFVTRFQGTNATVGQSYSGQAHFIVRQPNLLRVTATTSKGRFVIVSDGKVLTIHQPAKRQFRQMQARDSIVGNLYLVAGLIGVEIRMVDFFWTVDYLAARLGYGEVKAGTAKRFGDKTCDGYTLARDQDRWQVWIDRSPQRWPCHLVSKRVDGNAALTQTNAFTWQVAPAIAGGTFSFVAPEGHRGN